MVIAMLKNDKSEKAKKYGKVSDKPDSYLAGPLPTAHSEEFVPKPLENLSTSPKNGTNEIFDFIPELKTKNKYR